jgi:hypothetical protein
MSLKLDSQKFCRISNSHHEQRIYIFFINFLLLSHSKRLPKKLFSIKISICVTTMVYLTKNGKKSGKKELLYNALHAGTNKAAGLKFAVSIQYP